MRVGESGASTEVAEFRRKENEFASREEQEKQRDSHDEIEDIDWSSTKNITYCSKERRRDPLRDHVDRNRKIDLCEK